MIFLTRPEHKLLACALSPDADLSRDAIAEAVGVRPTSIGRILTRLRKAGLITISRGPHNVILKIEPTFEFAPGKTFKTMSAQQRCHWQ